jgi:hypothetical protein
LIHTLLLPEGQMTKAWELLKKQRLFGKQRALYKKKVLSLKSRKGQMKLQHLTLNQLFSR